MQETQKNRMSAAIRRWLIDLQNYPGWKEWKRDQLSHTLYFDDVLPYVLSTGNGEFRFSGEVEKQHAVIEKYIGLEETILSLKDCEFYFRRYPFHGLPVSKHDHITNICEMYFNRFYEFEARLKAHFEAVKRVNPLHNLDIGSFIRLFKNEFNQELRARNNVHHHRRFDDISITRIFLTESLAAAHEEKGWDLEHRAAYRKLVREWVERVRRRAAKLDEFMEAIASATLIACAFLSTE